MACQARPNWLILGGSLLRTVRGREHADLGQRDVPFMVHVNLGEVLRHHRHACLRLFERQPSVMRYIGVGKPLRQPASPERRRFRRQEI